MKILKMVLFISFGQVDVKQATGASLAGGSRSIDFAVRAF